MPSIDNIAMKTPALAIRVLQSMLSFFPDAMSLQSKKHVASSIHSSETSIRDESASFMIGVCSDFDDQNSLLEV